MKSCYDAPQDEIFGNQIGVSSQLGCSDNFNIDPAKIKKDLHLNIKGSFKTNEKICFHKFKKQFLNIELHRTVLQNKKEKNN